MTCGVLPGNSVCGATYALVQHVRRLESGADASLQDADGQTALDKAAAQVGLRCELSHPEGGGFTHVPCLLMRILLSWGPSASCYSCLVLYAGTC